MDIVSISLVSKAIDEDSQVELQRDELIEFLWKNKANNQWMDWKHSQRITTENITYLRNLTTNLRYELQELLAL